MRTFSFLLFVSWSLVGCVTGEKESDIVDSLACPAEPSSDSCQLYSCVEASSSCGEDGYPVAFGNRYCERFLGLCGETLFTEGEKRWAAAANQCMQAATFEAEVLGGDCKQLAAKSFEAHMHCFTGGAEESGADSFCALGPASWQRLRACIDGDDKLSKVGLLQYAKVLADCGKSLMSGTFLSGSDAPDSTIQKEWATEATKLSKQWVEEAK